MIKCYFGVPGCGKSTILVKEYVKNKRKYDHIYTINLVIKGVKKITKEDLEKYMFRNTLILWDEITIDADNREFKSFSRDLRDFFILHRHLGCDIIYATQNFEKVDKIVRDLTFGYRFCNFLESIFVSNYKLVFRPFYYRLFDTHDELHLKNRVLFEDSFRKV